MTTEFDLGCATCGGSLTERSVAAESLGVGGEGTVAVAECPECGDRYVPERTLDLVGDRERT
jgi:YgiT-type zinc finger domain-containing protein